MIRSVVEMISPTVDFLVLLYSFALVVSYVLMGGLAFYGLIRYIAKNKSTNYNAIFYSDSLEPSVSVIASCYNESLTIVDCLHSLLTLRYDNYEVIVVNDGSKDNTLEKVCEEFELEKIDYFIHERIPTKQVRGVYKSRNKAYYNLIVVDKENGGKADAMNAGFNISTRLYAVCIDVDSVLAPDALLKLVKPIIESSMSVVASVGGAVHVANGCLLRRGTLVEKKVPANYMVRMQIIEYLRTFLIGRIAFGKINGLMLVSGALGIFRKDLVLEVGGYRTQSIGEDMELIIRIRKYLYEHKMRHRVVYIPEPLLWTEVPSSGTILERQRTRWSRGLIDTLRLHKNVFFNRRYGVLGMVSFPYFVFFEWLAPFVEVLGMIYVALLIFCGMIQWKVYLFLFVFMYLFGVCFSFLGIFLSEMTYPVYNSKKDLMKLYLTSFTEIFFYHPRIVYWALKGNWMYLRGQNKWGDMVRQGFNKQ
ncbi:MAG: glycosyltransferase [Parabacteroides sp.]|nr:glycosyltransferase [Parabacteroides sp.]